MLYEDGYCEPVWLRYSRQFYARSKSKLFFMNREIQSFEHTHPHLKLIDINSWKTKNIVLNENSMYDSGLQAIISPAYTYESYHTIRYYQPSDDLLTWLTMIEEFTEYRAEKKNKLQLLLYEELINSDTTLFVVWDIFLNDNMFLTKEEYIILTDSKRQ